MSDGGSRGTGGEDDITTGHPSAHLRPAPEAGEVALPRSAAFPVEAHLPADTVAYGPDVPDESSLRLLGSLEGKRVLELGAGAGHNAVAIARQGAHVICVDPSHRRLELVRNAADREEVRVEVHQSDLAELAFVRADTIDVVLSVYALASVPDLDRVFRQVHRVLRSESPIVVSIPHPVFAVAQGGSYFEADPVPWEAAGASGEEVHRTVHDVFTSFGRANFRVDTLLEPKPAPGPRSPFWVDAMARVPATLIIRARKEGI